MSKTGKIFLTSIIIQIISFICIGAIEETPILFDLLFVLLIPTNIILFIIYLAKKFITIKNKKNVNNLQYEKKENQLQIKDISEIKNVLRRKAIGFQTGGIRPTNQLGESWIGKVSWQLPGESWPIGENGEKMIPLATLFLDGSEYIPNSLKNIKMINIFVDICLLDNLAEYSYEKWFKICTYESLDNLVKCDYISEEIRPFPLIPQVVDNEFPQWEDVEGELLKVISDMEKNGESGGYYVDIYEDNYHSHKIGGYPSTIQNGVEYDEGYEFVLQIASDPKAEFNIVDSGNFYFGYNVKNKDWEVRCDFY